MCEEEIHTKLKHIQRQFLCCVPVQKIEWLNVFNDLLWEHQEILINCTVNFDLILKYPVKISYQRAFLKFLITRLERQNFEINDVIFTSLGRLVTTIDDQKECFKHYLLKSGEIIILKENTNIISEGTTGLCSWQASIALSEWCLANKHVFTNKTVLELGSGVGLTGLTVALNCGPKKVFFTDCHSSVLDVLCSNIKLNLGHSSCLAGPDSERLLLAQTQHETGIEVLRLPWEGVTKNACDATNPDILLAADVIYDGSLFPSLVKALVCFLKCGDAKELVLACTERNVGTLEEFLLLLATNDLNCLEIDVLPQNNFVWATDSRIRMFSIKTVQSS